MHFKNVVADSLAAAFFFKNKSRIFLKKSLKSVLISVISGKNPPFASNHNSSRLKL
jgi:flagellar motor component MotA